MNAPLKQKPPMRPPNWVRRIRPEDHATLEALAHADNHSIIAATHVFEKHGELVGYASIGAVCLVLPWFDTQQCHAEDTLFYGNMVENLAAQSGAGLMCVPFVPQSPLHPQIERLGYLKAGDATLTFKPLKG